MTWRVRVVAQLSDIVPVWLLGIYRILVGDSGKTGLPSWENFDSMVRW